MPVPDLTAEGLACERGERTLFQGIGFALHGGEALQIEGRNGSGKTTLLRVICGLTRPSAGCLRWGGRDVQKDTSEYFGQLSYVGHHAGVKDDLTPLENLEFSMALSGHNTLDPDVALERVGLPVACEDIPCRKLSAGQRRRVALARLLLSDHPLWVLDEPLTALDAGGRRMLEQLVQNHLERGGMAVVTSHHALELGDVTVHRVHLD